MFAYQVTPGMIKIYAASDAILSGDVQLSIIPKGPYTIITKHEYSVENYVWLHFKESTIVKSKELLMTILLRKMPNRYIAKLIRLKLYLSHLIWS